MLITCFALDRSSCALVFSMAETETRGADVVTGDGLGRARAAWELEDWTCSLE